jgi:hypothetical protein
MGLLNAKNIAKAKDLALKNKHKIAPAVTKATSAIDKKTGGKHADKLKKLDDAAAKISGPAPDAPDAPAGPDEAAAPGNAPMPE